VSVAENAVDSWASVGGGGVDSYPIAVARTTLSVGGSGVDSMAMLVHGGGDSAMTCGEAERRMSV